MKNQPEYELQKAVCKWLNTTYPDVLFMSDTIASVKLTLPQGARNKSIQKAGFKTPYLIIFEPNKHFNGLFIELKTKSPFKANGELRKDDHLIGQQHTMFQLTRKGYKCHFSWSLDQTITIINDYLNNVNTDTKLDYRLTN